MCGRTRLCPILGQPLSIPPQVSILTCLTWNAICSSNWTHLEALQQPGVHGGWNWGPRSLARSPGPVQWIHKAGCVSLAWLCANVCSVWV